MNKPTALASVFVLVLAAVGCSGCGSPEQPHVEGPAPSPSQVSGPVYVSDTLGHPLTRPTGFGLTEFSSVNRLSWRSWGQEKAVATGRLRGMWCIPHCPRNGYPATVELSRLQRRENVSYYTFATVRSSHLPPADTDDLSKVRLPFPEP
ncbi:hypothetical protein RB199_29765 [Streptomyces libani]|uniref:Lipoprotein n=2 Tax=Streptomyces nigrescens TaxID=1920 RepID=A0A640THH9_STRNI|nr:MULTISPECIES: hypothetical protein [Streptomyces]AWN28690.1 hypothetical protein DKG71_23440 [Streptomyces sp. NEAU-S7GS2]MCX5445898.1 hypothetical protein [Streptomyces libani]WAT97513.1 hypothetical protein STRLI_003461 [Streptomyces libani subsp. libani]WAU05455.1 hypothetical protein STRNI_003831 [Streptomyces nigrescens]WDT56742.1 hypothetical protein NUT86_23305 [Streptomyces sp. G7(2002)]